MYIKHLILAEERKRERVTTIVIDFEYVHVCIDTETISFLLQILNGVASTGNTTGEELQMGDSPYHRSSVSRGNRERRAILVRSDADRWIIDGRRSDPPRDSSSFSSMCSANSNGGSLSPTDLFCSGTLFVFVREAP